MSKRWSRNAGTVALALAALALSPHLASGDPPDSPGSSDDQRSWHPGAERAAAAAVPAKLEVAAPIASDYAIAVPTPLPPAVAVATFTNRSEITSLDWLGPAIGFVAGELLAGHGRIRTDFAPLIVSASSNVTSPKDIAGFAEEQGARYVVAGSYSRPNWELELRVELWEVSHGAATRRGLVVNRGEFKLVHQFMSRSLISLFEKVDLGIEGADLAEVSREPTADFYAFTLFGRGLRGFISAQTPREWSEAQKNLERAVFIDPSFVEGQRVLGELYRELGRNGNGRYARLHGRAARKTLEAQALVRFERALEARPNYAAATTALAGVAEEREQTERARDLYAAVVRARPFDFEARYHLGKVLWDAGQAEDSFVVLEELVEHHPDDIRARRILVMIHSARGSGEALVTELEAVAKLDPKDEQTRMDLGAAYAAVDRNQDAIDAYSEVVAGNPRQVTALKFLGDLHKKSGRRDQAIKFYGLALSTAPWDPRAYFNLGALYVEGGEDDKARRIYQRAQRFRRYASEVNTNLGGIAFRAGRLDEALVYHLKAVKADPRRARFRYNLALALSADGQLEAADAEISMGLRYDAKHVALNYLKGVVLLRRGDVAAASIQFEKTLELEPEHEDAMHNLRLIEELRRRADEGELIRERRE